MHQFRRDLVTHRRTALAFAAFWFALLVVTALTWDRGMPAWLFFIHLLALPLCAGATTSDFRLNSGVAGLVVNLLDLFIVNTVPMGSLSLVAVPSPSGEPLFVRWALVFEVFEFMVLMGVPGYLLGLLGGTLGKRWAERRMV